MLGFCCFGFIGAGVLGFRGLGSIGVGGFGVLGLGCSTIRPLGFRSAVSLFCVLGTNGLPGPCRNLPV